MVFTLPGGTEDNDLWVRKHVDEDERQILSSVWVPTPEEREAIAAGANIRLNIWGTGHPPVLLDLTDEKLGAKRG